jgi:hypothetical protein
VIILAASNLPTHDSFALIPWEVEIMTLSRKRGPDAQALMLNRSRRNWEAVSSEGGAAARPGAVAKLRLKFGPW